MFGRKKLIESHAKKTVHSFVDSAASVRGDVSFSGGMEMRGKVYGSVLGEGEDATFIVGLGSVIHGGIEAEHVVVDGRVQGNVVARSTLLVRANGVIQGDVSYGRIQMEEGASVDGRLTRLRESPELATEKREEISSPEMPSGALPA